MLQHTWMVPVFVALKYRIYQFLFALTQATERIFNRLGKPFPEIPEANLRCYCQAKVWLVNA